MTQHSGFHRSSLFIFALVTKGLPFPQYLFHPACGVCPSCSYFIFDFSSFIIASYNSSPSHRPTLHVLVENLRSNNLIRPLFSLRPNHRPNQPV